MQQELFWEWSGYKDVEYTEKPKEISNGYIETYSGKKFYPLNPFNSEIDIIDIAHALSLLCRYNGHTKVFYSVAEHSILLSEYTEKILKRNPRDVQFALLHDAGEAYTSDIPTPLKKELPEFKNMESVIDAAVLYHFNLPSAKPNWLKDIDTRIIRDERMTFMSRSNNIWFVDELKPLDIKFKFMTPEIAEFIFLEEFSRLQNLRMETE